MKKLEGDRVGLIERLRSDSERQLRFKVPETEEIVSEHYGGIGASLREARERSGLDLFSVANTLRIQPSHLSAIEAGEFEKLPGPTYAVGFLRTYAAYLGLDGEVAVRRFKEETELAPAKTKLVFPEPVEETRRPTMRVVLLALLVAGGVYGGWIYLERHGELDIEAVMEPPRRLVEMLGSGTTAEREDVPVSTAPVAAGDMTPVGQAETVPNGSADTAPASIADAPPVMPSATPAGTDTAPAPATSQMSDSRTMPAMESVSPTRVEVAPVEPVSNTAVASRADAGAGGDPSAGERAAAADVGSMSGAATEEARETVPEGTAAKPTATGTATPLAEVVTPPLKPAMESGNAAVATAATATTGSEGTRVEEEESAPAIPQIEANVAPPLPPALPAAPPPAPAAESAGSGEATASASSESDQTAERQYRPQRYGSANDPGKVLVRARADSWVQVQGANNELLLTRILRAGDVYYAPDRSDLVLMTGNAGAIEVVVEGNNLGTLGPIGAVRRNIALNPEGLREFIRGRTDRAQ